jgi:hypothetical protein
MSALAGTDANKAADAVIAAAVIKKCRIGRLPPVARLYMLQVVIPSPGCMAFHNFTISKV